jgi:hypothetical protein
VAEASTITAAAFVVVVVVGHPTPIYAGISWPKLFWPLTFSHVKCFYPGISRHKIY